MVVSLANRECEQLSGYSREEVEGRKRWTEFILKDDLAKMIEYHKLRSINPDSAPKNYEFHFVNRAGDVKDVLLTVDVIPGTKKRIASLLDITKRKKTEEELKKSRRDWEDIFQAIGHPAVILDPEHNIILANHAVAKITGKTLEELNPDCPLEMRREVSGKVKRL